MIAEAGGLIPFLRFERDVGMAELRAVMSPGRKASRRRPSALHQELGDSLRQLPLTLPIS